jgi:hypothetical protein
MPTKLTRVEEVLRSQVPAASKVSDASVIVICPSCQTRQSLIEATIAHDGTETIYTCTKKCQPIVIVSDPLPRELPGRGHRFGSFMIRNVTEMNIATSPPMKLAASPSALESISGRTLKYRL